MNECPQHGGLNADLSRGQSRYRFVRCAHIGAHYVDQIDDENGVLWIDYQRGGAEDFHLIDYWYKADIENEGLTTDAVWDQMVDRMRQEAR